MASQPVRKASQRRLVRTMSWWLVLAFRDHSASAGDHSAIASLDIDLVDGFRWRAIDEHRIGPPRAMTTRQRVPCAVQRVCADAMSA